MPHLSPPTLTEGEVRAILAATAGNRRDHVIYSLALGTGLRLTEIVGLNVGVFSGRSSPYTGQYRFRDSAGWPAKADLCVSRVLSCPPHVGSRPTQSC